MLENSLNDFSKEKNPKSSSYDLAHSNLLTARFGELTPFFHRETLRGDKFRFGNDLTLRTYTLASPLLSPVRVHKDYYYVPNLALLPNFWKYIEVNPKFGEDIDASKWNSVVNFASLVSNFSSLCHVLETNWSKDNIAQLYRIMALYRGMFGKGSLLHYLGYVFPTMVSYSDTCIAIDNFIQTSGVFGATISSDDSFYSLNKSDKSSRVGLFDFIVENPQFNLLFTSTAPVDFTSADAIISTIADSIDLFSIELDKSPDSFTWNVRDLLAYQSVVYHYFTSDDVDNVYSCETWLDTMQAVAESILGTEYPSNTLNGKSYHCDVFAGSVFQALISNFASLEGDTLTLSLAFWLDLLCYKHSLRYGDRFVGSRKQPLAVGNVNVSVNNNTVNVVDITKNIQMQRFLNAVNRVPQKLKDYAAGIFGEVSFDDSPTTPKWLASSVQALNNPEVDNTAENQGKQTSYLEDRTSKYEFESEFRGNGVVIGLLSFDVLGSYASVQAPEHYAVDRYDYFIPELQHIGDEAVTMKEYDVDSSYGHLDSTFAYQVRNSEYKFANNEVHGGFLSDSSQLDSWYFNNSLNPSVNKGSGISSEHISSTFIRHYPYQFDKFYTLTGVDLENRFHFIVRSVNNLTAQRNMVRKPTIL